MDNMNSPQIMLKDITKDFFAAGEKIPALKGINLSVMKGDFISIMGHSGSGKTTLLSLIGGLLDPTLGRLSVDGNNICGFQEKELARYRAEKIGFIFQSASLLPSLTIMENMLFPVLFASGNSQKKTQEEEALSYLDMIGLAKKADVYPYQLSGGEARRVSLVRALMNKPEILLADEPTGDLDEHTERSVMDILERLHQEIGFTLVMVTHNDELARRAKRTFTLVSGLLEENNP